MRSVVDIDAVRFEFGEGCFDWHCEPKLAQFVLLARIGSLIASVLTECCVGNVCG